MAACKEALRINPVEKRVKDTLRRIHARAVAEVGRTPVPPPLPLPDLDDDEADIWSALTGLAGSELVDRAMEILARTEATDDAEASTRRPPLPLFAELEREAFVDVVLKMDLRGYRQGEAILEQGAPGDAVYVICAGGARVFRRGENGVEAELAHLPGGTLVGEMALLTDAPRSASVVAERASEVFVLSRRDLEELAEAHPAVPQQLVGFCRKRLLANLVRTSPIFQPFDAKARLALLAHFTSRVHGPGEVIIREGQAGEGMSVILTGAVQVTRQDESGDAVHLATLREGDVFGEIALIRDAPATATVRATRKTAVVTLPADDFAHLVADNEAVRAWLRGLTDDRLRRNAQAMAATAEVVSEDDLVVL